MVTGVRDNQQPDDLEAREGVYVTIPDTQLQLQDGVKGVRSGPVTPADV